MSLQCQLLGSLLQIPVYTSGNFEYTTGTCGSLHECASQTCMACDCIMHGIILTFLSSTGIAWRFRPSQLPKLSDSFIAQLDPRCEKYFSLRNSVNARVRIPLKIHFTRVQP